MQVSFNYNYKARSGNGLAYKIDEFFFNFNDQPNMSLTSWKKVKDEKGNEIYTKE